MPRILLPLAASLSLSLLLSAPVFAEEKGDAGLAEALFQDGRRLMDEKDYDQACPKFEESYRLVSKLGTLLNLATCHDKQGKTGTAFSEYTKALSIAKERGEQDRMDYTRAQLDELAPRLSKLVLELPHADPDTEVFVDGKPLGQATWGTPLPLDPGTHALEVRAPGKKPWTRDAKIPEEPGSVILEVPALQDAPDDAAPEPTPTEPSPPSDDDGSTQRVLGFVVGGVGLVGIGVGAVFGLQTFSKQSDSEDHCVDTRCDQEGVDLRDEASTTGLISTIGFGAGVALAAVGVVLIATAGGDDMDPEARTSAGVWLGASGDSTGANVRLGGRF